jgi:hypothetical protein
MSNYTHYDYNGNEYKTDDNIPLYGNYVYYIDSKQFTTENYNKIPWKEISSPDENTPALEYPSRYKLWCKKRNICHRLAGPARIWSDGDKRFYLNGKYYNNIREWIKEHPNPDLYFHNIGVFTKTDKVLWFLQN